MTPEDHVEPVGHVNAPAARAKGEPHGDGREQRQWGAGGQTATAEPSFLKDGAERRHTARSRR